MNADTSDDFFAPPAFKPAEALVLLKRQLRELKPLTERGSGFELKGSPVIQLQAEADMLTVRLAKRRSSRTPEWETRGLRSSADVRKLVDELKKRVARWDEDEHAA